MQKRYLLSSLLILLPTLVLGQTTDSTKKGPWNHSIVANLNLSQASYSNWTGGGENTLAYQALLTGSSEDNAPSATWTNTYKFTYGQARLGDQGLRKTDDQIDLESLLKYKYDSAVNPYAAASFRSQFTPGYTYSASDSATMVSKFFDPAYFQESVGALYTVGTVFKTRVGAAVREVVTTEFTQYAVDPETNKPERTLVEGGFESITELNFPIDDHILLTSKLDLFSPVKKPAQIIVRSDNGLTVKVSKYVIVNLNALFINDASVTPKTQIKQTLALGIEYAIL
jgi:hypothetical protein